MSRSYSSNVGSSPPRPLAALAGGRMHGVQPVGARDGRLKVISNCRVLGEGVDVPAVDLVAFIDAKSSHVDILQSMARASRVERPRATPHRRWA